MSRDISDLTWHRMGMILDLLYERSMTTTELLEALKDSVDFVPSAVPPLLRMLRRDKSIHYVNKIWIHQKNYTGAKVSMSIPTHQPMEDTITLQVGPTTSITLRRKVGRDNNVRVGELNGIIVEVRQDETSFKVGIYSHGTALNDGGLEHGVYQTQLGGSFDDYQEIFDEIFPLYLAQVAREVQEAQREVNLLLQKIAELTARTHQALDRANDLQTRANSLLK